MFIVIREKSCLRERGFRE